MASAARYVPKNYRWFNRLLRYSYGIWLKVFFRVRVLGGILVQLDLHEFEAVEHDVQLLGQGVREPGLADVDVGLERVGQLLLGWSLEASASNAWHWEVSPLPAGRRVVLISAI